MIIRDMALNKLKESIDYCDKLDALRLNDPNEIIDQLFYQYNLLVIENEILRSYISPKIFDLLVTNKDHEEEKELLDEKLKQVNDALVNRIQHYRKG